MSTTWLISQLQTPLKKVQRNYFYLCYANAYAAYLSTRPSGSLEYMAPEVLKGQSASASSDLYMLGITAIQLLTGSTARTVEGIPKKLAKVHSLLLGIKLTFW